MGEVKHMNKERFGAFIAQRRRELDLTQRDLAEALHLTDKAVSKWERGLSYPDVTLLEPLAEKLELTVGELMACRVGALAPETGKEEPMETLMTISKDTVRRERRRSWGRLIGVLVLVLVTAIVIGYSMLFVSEAREDFIVLTETVDGADYIYVEENGHLLKLECCDTVDLDGIQLENEWGEQQLFRMSYRYNRLSREGTVTGLCSTGDFAMGGIMDVKLDGGEWPLFGLPMVHLQSEGFYPNPHAEGYLCDLVCWIHTNPKTFDSKEILRVEDCLSGIPWDTDGDGENELVIRTRWPEKPYTVYDMVDGEITETWPDTVPQEVQEALRCIWEE